MRDNRAVARARALIGVRFALHGRTPDGVDCVGLVAHAHQCADRAPTDYDLRTSRNDHWIGVLDQILRRAKRIVPRAGDVLLMQAGPAQLHLGIWTGAALIHGHASLRRVVETPGLPVWPVIGIWHARRRA